MNKHNKNGLIYYSFKNLDNTGLVKNAFSTRLGGVSSGCYESLNLGYNRGDNDENVDENYRRLGGVLGIDINNTTSSHQTHETNIYTVNLPTQNLEGIDALLTNKKNMPILTYYADCVPLLFLDVQKRIIANAHSGWQGTLKNMASAVVQRMTAEFGSSPADILVGIGPSISQKNFEVDSDVADDFLAKLPQCEPFIEKRGNKFHIDLWALNELLLVEAGILKQNIEIANICTYENETEFFSHRRSGIKRGSMVAIMELS